MHFYGVFLLLSIQSDIKCIAAISINHAAFKAAEIIRGKSLQIGGCSIKPSQIAFLVATRRDAEMVKKALEKFQIEAINLSNDSVFKQQTAHDLIQILGAIICSKNIIFH